MRNTLISDNELHLEGVALNTVADAYGTPCYVYSRAAIEDAYKQYTDALCGHPSKVCYAVKANSNLAILQLLAQLGASFDIVSGGELERVLRAGGLPENIIFSGVGKTRAEISRALDIGIACFNIESEPELHQLAKIASYKGVTANISLRVNPDVDANTHPYISTGLKENKFGVAIEDAMDLYKKADTLTGIKIIGVDCHIGSQLTDDAPFLDALERLLVLIDQLQAVGINIEHIDLGGGLGITYRDESPPAVSSYIAQIKNRLGRRKLQLILEPGRSIVGNAGLLLTEVLYLKHNSHKNFAIVDAAMNDIIRPSLYQAWQEILPLRPRANEEEKVWDIVGPICETSDFLAKERQLRLVAGDRLALMSSGAYSFVMSSNYNTRCRAPEILIDGSHVHLVRERENFEDLIRGERLLDEGTKD